MEKEMMKSFQLHESAKYLMSYFCSVLGTENFILYGGAPIDMMLDENCEINDYDLAINGKSEGIIKKVTNSLIAKGFKIIEKNRKYFIYQNIEVILVYAKKDKMTLDVCFMDDVDLVGQFNVESLYWKHPEMKLVDQYEAIKSIRNKEIIPIRDFNKENTLLLMSRFLYLCSKYDFELSGDHGNKIIAALHVKLKEYSHEVSQQYVSCLSSIFKSIIRAKKRIVFIAGLVDSGLLKIAFPLLHDLLVVVLKNKQSHMVLEKLDSKNKLLGFLAGHLKNEEIIEFRSMIVQLSERKWDEQDVGMTLVS